MHMDISLSIYIIKLKVSVNIINVLLAGSMSQIFYLGPSFYFMLKKLVTFSKKQFNPNFYIS